MGQNRDLKEEKGTRLLTGPVGRPVVLSLPVREPWTIIVIMILVSFLCLGGCARVQPPGEDGAGQEGSPAAMATLPRTSSGEQPVVLILSPPFDGGIIAGDVTVLVQVEHISIGSSGGMNLPGTMHLIYYLDAVPPVAPGRPAYSAPGTYAASPSTSHTWHGVAPGTHTFSVQLVNRDDIPLEPPVLDAVDVTAVSPGDIIVH